MHAKCRPWHAPSRLINAGLRKGDTSFSWKSMPCAVKWYVCVCVCLNSLEFSFNLAQEHFPLI